MKSKITRIIILLSYSFVNLYLIVTKKILKYVHPKIIPIIVISIIIMSIASMILILNIKIENHNKSKKNMYIIFIIPIAMILFIPFKQSECLNTNFTVTQNISIDNKEFESAGKQSISNNDVMNSKEIDINEVIENNKLDEKIKELILENDVIVVTDNNFVKWMDELYENKIYENKEIQITGFAYKESNFSKSEFVIARYIMVCCAAHMAVGGLMCNYMADDIQQDSWYNISGTIKYETYDGETLPIIKVNKAVETETPSVEYVYPY